MRCYRDRFKTRPTKILLNVCLNLVIAYIIFVVGVENVSNNLTCIIVTILLHYFFLASWCWMTVYSYDLYLSLVKVSVRKSVYKVGTEVDLIFLRFFVKPKFLRFSEKDFFFRMDYLLSSLF